MAEEHIRVRRKELTDTTDTCVVHKQLPVVDETNILLLRESLVTRVSVSTNKRKLLFKQFCNS